MNDIEIALEDLDTLVEIARQHTGIASWLGLVQSALIMKEALEKQIELNDYLNTLRKNKKYQIYDILSEFALEVEND